MPNADRIDAWAPGSPSSVRRFLEDCAEIINDMAEIVEAGLIPREQACEAATRLSDICRVCAERTLH